FPSYCTVRTAATFTLKISSMAPLISVFDALRSTRKVKTCPVFRPLFSSVESSFRMTLFSVTTGDFKISQPPALLIVGRLLLCYFLRRLLWSCLLRVLCLCRFRLGCLLFFFRFRLLCRLYFFSSLGLRLCFLLCLRFRLDRRSLFFGSFIL